MRQFISNHKMAVGVGGGAGLALVAYLAFGFFGIHTAFVDSEVSEAGPIFASGARIEESEEMIDGETADEEATETQSVEASPDGETVDTVGEASSEPAVQTVTTGSFMDSAIHSGTGDVVTLTDRTQTFLRFEENFATDNGPDLNVYLRANDGSGDFLDLGDLKGNIGSQNYEIPAGTDLTRFTVVDIWCVRFGVSFTEAELA